MGRQASTSNASVSLGKIIAKPALAKRNTLSKQDKKAEPWTQVPAGRVFTNYSDSDGARACILTLLEQFGVELESSSRHLTLLECSEMARQRHCCDTSSDVDDMEDDGDNHKRGRGRGGRGRQ